MRKGGAKKNNRTENRHTLASLKEENRILRAELKRLNRTLRMHSVSNNDKRDRSENRREQKLFEIAQSTAVSLASSSYLKYVFAKISKAALYSLFKKILSGFRKFKLVSTIIRIISSALAILGTGAFFIFVSGTVIFFIPAFILLCASAYITGMLFRKKAFKLLGALLTDKTIFVFFPSAGKPFREGSYFRKSIISVSHDTDAKVIVLIVSPYLVSTKGFGGKGYYPVTRMEDSNICLIRKNAFFALRRKILRLHGERISYIY